ncbi:MAG: hypothetical protein A3I66_04410 [Burkholderiales bacterium RIFCSPLOWO2_02_FULL_57_36]|nr:MAG: hypothetical protein A3I66_04410 [Burkholderiales bacterium RIFCSPLOWO2_02_FULL_57_36]
MTYHTFSRTILISCMLVVFSGLARAEVTRCVDNTGKLSYTTGLCKEAGDAVPASTARKPSAVKSGASSAKKIGATKNSRETAWAKTPANIRKRSLDAATAKAAKSSILLIDEERFLLHQQKLALLD